MKILSQRRRHRSPWIVGASAEGARSASTVKEWCRWGHLCTCRLRFTGQLLAVWGPWRSKIYNRRIPNAWMRPMTVANAASVFKADAIALLKVHRERACQPRLRQRCPSYEHSVALRWA